MISDILPEHIIANGLAIRGASHVVVVASRFSGNGSSVVPGPGLEHNLLLTRVAGGKVSGSILEGSQFGSGLDILANPVTVTIGGQPAAIDFAGVVGAGLVQINVHVPISINNGDAPVLATVGGASTQTTANLISIHN